jgi:hypothetical protein
MDSRIPRQAGASPSGDPTLAFNTGYLSKIETLKELDVHDL